MKWLAKSPGNIWLGWETYRNTAFWRHLAVTLVSIVTNVCVYIQSLCFYQILLHGTAVPSHFTKTDDPDKEQSFHSTQMHIYLIKSKEFKPRKDPVLLKIDYQCSQLIGRECKWPQNSSCLMREWEKTEQKINKTTLKTPVTLFNLAMSFLSLGFLYKCDA